MPTPCDSPSTPRVQGSSSPDNPQPLCFPWQIDAFSKAPRSRLSPSSKVRRDLVGGRRGTGQRDRRRVHRPDASRIVIGPDDPTLSSFGGLVGFNAMLETLGVATSLRALCAPLKTGRTVVYPMETQVRLLLDLLVVGGTRIFDLEYLVGDPLFVHLAGGRVCCVDTLYTDLARFDDEARRQLAALLTQQGLAALRGRLLTRLHLDIDTSVCPVFGDDIEGAVPGYNPLYHGRNSYHPLLARIAETGTLLGAQLRPGNTTLGQADVAQIDLWLTALDEYLRDSPCLVTVRIDKGGDCAALFQIIAAHRRRFLVKARMTEDLVREIVMSAKWTTTDKDADGSILQQVAEIDFVRAEWRERKLAPIRVVLVRSRQRQGGKKLDDSGLTVQAFFTNDWDSAPEDVVLEYDGRAGIEPLIAELKQAWGMEKVSGRDFGANAAMLLLKGLAMNLLRRFVRQAAPGPAQRWRTSAVRRLLLLRPARLVRSGRLVTVRLGRLPAQVKRE
jgi:hypothetical protein